ADHRARVADGETGASVVDLSRPATWRTCHVERSEACSLRAIPVSMAARLFAAAQRETRSTASASGQQAYARTVLRVTPVTRDYTAERVRSFGTSVFTEMSQ